MTCIRTFPLGCFVLNKQAQADCLQIATWNAHGDRFSLYRHEELCNQKEQLHLDLQMVRSRADAQANEAAAQARDLQARLEAAHREAERQAASTSSKLATADAEVKDLRAKLDAAKLDAFRASSAAAASAASLQPSQGQGLDNSGSTDQNTFGHRPTVPEQQQQQQQAGPSGVSRVPATRQMPCAKCVQHAAADQDMNRRLEFILADRERLLGDRATAEAQLNVAEEALETQHIRHNETLSQVGVGRIFWLGIVQA